MLGTNQIALSKIFAILTAADVAVSIYGQQVYGQQVYGRPVYGRQVYGRQLYGRQIYGRQIYGRQIYGKQGAPKQPAAAAAFQEMFERFANQDGPAVPIFGKLPSEQHCSFSS